MQDRVIPIQEDELRSSRYGRGGLVKEDDNYVVEEYRDRFTTTEAVIRAEPDAFPSSSGAGALRIGRVLSHLVSRRERAAVARLMSLVPGTVFSLDGPAGAGKMVNELRSRGAYVGLDSSWHALKVLTTVQKGAAIQGDLMTLPIKDNCVDLFLCHRFLHRMPPSVRVHFLLEMRRVTRRWAIVYYGIGGWTQRVVMTLERTLGMGDRGTLFLCGIEDAKEELGRSGWQVVEWAPIARWVSTGYVFFVQKN